MPTVEIDETELANLPAMRQFWAVAQKVAAHPKARVLQQQAVAEAMPDAVGPEHRLRQEFTEGLAGIAAELKADREAREKAANEAAERDRVASLENQWATTRGAARQQGYTDEGLTQLEAWMEKKGIADHTLAIPAFERENPPPEPLMTGGQKWNFFDQPTVENPDYKALLDGNEDAFMGKAIQSALRDVRNQR